MNMIQNITSMFADSIDGSVSSKRVVTFIAFVLCSIAFISNLFWGLKVEDYIYNSMVYIVIAGLGFTGMEKFAPTK
jgi:hypothetical protein